jgi:hypothetical protein
LLKVRISTACLLVLAEVSLSVPSGAEWRTHRAESMLRVEKSLVLIPVSATDIDGRFVAGLRSEDFDVREDGNAHGSYLRPPRTGLSPYASFST